MSDEVSDLWGRFADPLRTAWLRRGVRAADADDLLQETFLRIQRGLPRLRESAVVTAWVRAIARNVLADHRRARAPVVLEEPERVEDEARDPSLDAVAAGWLRGMIERLPPVDRSVLVLSDLEERPLAEVAARTGLSLTATKSRVQRGRRKLQRLLVECCRFETDRRGGIVGYERRGPRCIAEGCDGTAPPDEGALTARRRAGSRRA